MNVMISSRFNFTTSEEIEKSKIDGFFGCDNCRISRHLPILATAVTSASQTAAILLRRILPNDFYSSWSASIQTSSDARLTITLMTPLTYCERTDHLVEYISRAPRSQSACQHRLVLGQTSTLCMRRSCPRQGAMQTMTRVL